MKFRILGKPVLQELDVRHDDLRRGADFMPDLGHEELLAFGRRDLGDSGGGCCLDKLRLLSLIRLVPLALGDLVNSQQLARRAPNPNREQPSRNAVEHEQECRRPRRPCVGRFNGA